MESTQDKYKKKFKHVCGYCDARFATITDHMSHVVTKHDTGYRGYENRLLRPVSCWRCGTTDMYPDPVDGQYRCECGFELPTNWVNGQLVVDEEDEQKRD